MMCKPRFWIGLMASIVGVQLSVAATVTELIAHSDVVVIATPNTATNRGDGIALDLMPKTSLAGVPAGTGMQHVLWNGLDSAQRGAFRLPAQPKTGIWFLKDLHNGFYSPLAIDTPSALSNLYIEIAQEGACPTAFSYAQDESLENKIAMELACSASLGLTTNLQASRLVALCGSGTSSRAQGAAAQLIASPGPRQKAIGIACMVSANDPAGLALLEQSLPQLSQQDVTSLIAPRLLSWTGSDAASISSLGRIAVNPATQGRLLQTAAYALAAIHTPDTMPWIDKLLDRPDLESRMAAIGGIIRLINGYPAPTVANFRDMSFMRPSPTPYSNDESWKSYVLKPEATLADTQAAVSFWKAWLRSNKLVQ